MTQQRQQEKQRQVNLQRKIRSLLLVAVSGGALIATPQFVRADFIPNPTAPNYIASGAQITPQAITEDNTQITTDETFSVTTSNGNALTISGNGALVYKDSNGAELVTTSAHSALSVTTYGDADSTPGSITITTTGKLSGGANGIEVLNLGSGNTSITTTGIVTGTGTNGIQVFNSETANDLSVTAVDVHGGNDGISTTNNGSGNTSVTATGAVTATREAGVSIRNGINGQDLTINVADVTGGNYGILAENKGSGNTSVTSTGTVTGTSQIGMEVKNDVNAQDLTVNAVDVTSATTGIYAENKGSGDTSVTSTGTVTGTNRIGMEVKNDVNAQDLTVNAVDVTSNKTGIYAENKGSGNTSVTSTGTVSGGDDYGINAKNAEQAQDLTVSAATVTGGQVGISAENLGSGDTTVTATGTVTGTSNAGINASNGEDAVDLTVNAVNVTSGQVGIRTQNNGTGHTTVTATGTVAGIGIVGIDAQNGETAQGLSVSAAGVTSALIGITAINRGSGDTTITATGSVTGTATYGIQAVNNETANDLSVNAVEVYGGLDGINATNNGKGNTSITVTDTVTGTGYNGIHAENAASAVDLTVTAVDVQGGNDGISTTNNGSGNTSITVTGTVTATNQAGLSIHNGINGQDLTINVADVTGGLYGILAENKGNGNTSVTSTGTVTGTSQIGMEVKNDVNAQDLTVNAVDVTSATTGIYISNQGSGHTSLASSGIIFGGGDYAIYADNGKDAQDLTVNAVTVTSGQTGIKVINNGIGHTSITTTGTVTGTTQIGINVTNETNAQDLTLSVNTVSGGTTGIQAENKGTGDTRITATGLVAGGIENGITARNTSSSGDILIDVVSVTGGYNGIEVENSGSGDLHITASDAVTGSTGDGIVAANSSPTGNLLIEVASVTGGESGIIVGNDSGGDLRITASGPVTGETRDGIIVGSSGPSGDVVIEVTSVMGGENGIVVANDSEGDLRITASGAVTGATRDGIVVVNASTSGDLLIDVASVTGGESGIVVANDSEGDLRIMASGTVSGAAGDGIVVGSRSSSGDVVIDVTSVTGGESGIVVGNDSEGDLRITASGTVSGAAGDGIVVDTGSSSGNLFLDVANVIGSNTGITAENFGQANTYITVSGMVEGGTAGISASTNVNQTIEININGNVRNSSQNPASAAIISSSGIVEINNNNLLTGTISLGNEGNTFNNNGTWNAAGGTNSLGVGVNLLDNRAGGTILAATAQGPVTTIFTGVGTMVHAGSIVLQNREAGGQTAYTGDVAIFTNGGTGNFQSNGGRVLLDTDFENGVSDRLVVDNVSVASAPTRVYINPIGAVTPTNAEGINVVEVTGTSANDSFVLGNSLGNGLYAFKLGRGLSSETEQNWYLQSSGELRGEAPLAGALSVLAGRTSLATLSSIHERQREGDDALELYTANNGPRMVSRNVTLPESEHIARKGVWGRVFGQNNKFSSEGGTGAGYDTKLWGAQVGLDLVASGSQDKGRSYGGVYLGYASSSGDGLRGNTRLGTLKVDATSVGAYYTHISGNGFYWDAVAQYSRISDARMKYLGETSKSEGSSYLASFEAGQQFNRESKYVAEVQGQLLYQKTRIDELALADSSRLNVNSQSGLTGRVGVRLARNPHQGATFQPWVSANLWRTFNQSVRVSSLGQSATTPAGGTTGEVQLGFSLVPQRASGWSAYFAGGYQFDVSGSEYSGWRGSIGVRKGW